MNSPDFLDELAELALGSRLKRLSDRLMTDVSQIYKMCGHNIQPKWFTLLALLYRKKRTSVVEASEMLGLTQPAISQFVKELQANGMVIIKASEIDFRRKYVSLSEEGYQLVAEMQPMWRAVRSAANQLCKDAGGEFFESVKSFEKAISNQSLLQRTVTLLDSSKINSDIEIVEFKPELADYFKSINSEWITDMFELEDCDREILDNPEEIVIKAGGKIYFARLPELGIVGTCALLKKGENSFELTKMGVNRSVRGKKIGETLLAYVISDANKMQISNLFLLTNSLCEAAIHLYLKFGFEHDPETMHKYAVKYDRCNVAMRYFGG